MSTRGVFGFRYQGADKISYNSSDSYPSGLGNEVKDFCIKHTLENLKKCADSIRIAPENEEEEYNLIDRINGGLNDRPLIMYIKDYSTFLKDSLFCEWGYVINLDEEVLEVYEGFQTVKPPKNRYAINKKYKTVATDKEGYWNCKLIARIPLTELPNFDMNKLEEEGFKKIMLETMYR